MKKMDDKTSGAVGWLLSSAEPAVRQLGQAGPAWQDAACTGEVLDGPMVRALLPGQGQDGGFGIHPYPSGPEPIGGC